MNNQTIRILSLLLVFLVASANTWSSAGEKKKIVETSFEVQGICGMCKDLIETTAMDIKGVKMASWDKQSRQLTVVYNSKKISEESIHQAIADVGYDTSKIKASKSAYDGLAGCCKYREGQNTH